MYFLTRIVYVQENIHMPCTSIRRFAFNWTLSSNVHLKTTLTIDEFIFHKTTKVNLCNLRIPFCGIDKCKVTNVQWIYNYQQDLVVLPCRPKALKCNNVYWSTFIWCIHACYRYQVAPFLCKDLFEKKFSNSWEDEGFASWELIVRVKSLS